MKQNAIPPDTDADFISEFLTTSEGLRRKLVEIVVFASTLRKEPDAYDEPTRHEFVRVIEEDCHLVAERIDVLLATAQQLKANATVSSTDTLSVSIVRAPGTEDLPLPTYATAGAAGMDLRAAVEEEILLRPGERQAISTGIIIAVPLGYEAQVRPRSGLALRHGIGMVNAPGTIDSDFRGIVQVILINHGGDPFMVRRGDRIAQLVIAPVVRVVWDERPEPLSETERGGGGFGHTGKD